LRTAPVKIAGTYGNPSFRLDLFLIPTTSAKRLRLDATEVKPSIITNNRVRRYLSLCLPTRPGPHLAKAHDIAGRQLPKQHDCKVAGLLCQENATTVSFGRKADKTYAGEIMNSRCAKMGNQCHFELSHCLGSPQTSHKRPVCRECVIAGENQ
jgi:hypothetical protein